MLFGVHDATFFDTKLCSFSGVDVLVYKLEQVCKKFAFY